MRKNRTYTAPSAWRYSNAYAHRGKIHMLRIRQFAMSGSISLAVLLAACGGGDNGSGGDIPVVTAPTPTPTPTGTPTPTATNTAPVANPGANQNVLTKTSVTLDASASVDANGDPLTYKWVLKSRPSGSAAVRLGLVTASATTRFEPMSAMPAGMLVNPACTSPPASAAAAAPPPL